MSTAPFELLIAQFALYLAAVGEAYPAIEDAPAGNWTLIGASGSDNYDESGVVINHDQALNPIRTYGATGPRKFVRTTEDLKVTLNLVDLTLEEYTRIIADVAVATTAAGGGAAGFKEINLLRGISVPEIAILLRADQSAYGDGWNTQYEIPRAVQTGSQSPTFVKGDAPMLVMEYSAVEDLSASTDAQRFGRIVSQNAAPV